MVAVQCRCGLGRSQDANRFRHTGEAAPAADQGQRQHTRHLQPVVRVRVRVSRFVLSCVPRTKRAIFRMSLDLGAANPERLSEKDERATGPGSRAQGKGHGPFFFCEQLTSFLRSGQTDKHCNKTVTVEKTTNRSRTHDFVSSLGKRSCPDLEAKPGILT